MNVLKLWLISTHQIEKTGEIFSKEEAQEHLVEAASAFSKMFSQKRNGIDVKESTCVARSKTRNVLRCGV